MGSHCSAPLGKLGHRQGQLLQSLQRQLPVPRLGLLGKLSMKKPKLGAKGCLEELDPDKDALGEP